MVYGFFKIVDVGIYFVTFLKVVSATFLPVCFLSRKESTCETIFVHFKSSFCSRENQILGF